MVIYFLLYIFFFGFSLALISYHRTEIIRPDINQFQDSTVLLAHIYRLYRISNLCAHLHKSYLVGLFYFFFLRVLRKSVLFSFPFPKKHIVCNVRGSVLVIESLYATMLNIVKVINPTPIKVLITLLKDLYSRGKKSNKRTRSFLSKINISVVFFCML